jgi:hypothetical protein
MLIRILKFNLMKNNIDFLKENSAECTLFLNKNEAFPLSSPCKLLLVGVVLVEQ